MSFFRRTGYRAHRVSELEDGGLELRRRKYDVVFLYMSEPERSLTDARCLCGKAGGKAGKAIIGILPVDRTVSDQACKLSGMDGILREPLEEDAVRKTMITLLGARD